LPDFDGCISGTVTITEACAEVDEIVIPASYVEQLTATQTAAAVNKNIIISIIGCCTTNNCSPGDGVTSTLMQLHSS